MKQLIFISLCLVNLGFALDLPEALANAKNRTAVVNAESASNDAEANLTRSQADPLALRLEKTQAVQRAKLSKAQFTQARYQAYADITAAYTQVIESEAQLELAQKAKALSLNLREIADIRLSKGSITVLEVQEAQNDLEDSEKNLLAAEQGLALSQTNLESLIAEPIDAVSPIEDTLIPAQPNFETVLLSLQGHPNLLEANQGFELAEIGLDLLDVSYASVAQIDEATLQRDQAEEFAKEARRGLEIQARSLYNNAQTAKQTFQVQQAAYENSLEREALDKQRLEAGLIAEIAFSQTQLASLQAKLSALQAKHNYLKALLDLQAGTMTALGGLNEF